MATEQYTLEVRAGSTCSFVAAWKQPDGTAVNMTGYTVTLRVGRNRLTTPPSLTLTSPTGISIVAGTGTTTVTITDEQTAALVAAIAGGWGEFDLDAESSGGVITRLVQGPVRLLPRVPIS